MVERNNIIEDEKTRDYSGKSLARHLLSWVLGLYLLVAVVSTAVQLFYQYQRERSHLLGTLKQVETLLAPNLAAAVWDFNTVQLVAGSRSVLAVPLLSGISIKDATGEIMLQAGEVVTPNGSVVLLDENGKPLKELKPGTLIEHTFELNHHRNEQIFPVGRTHIFANRHHLVKALKGNLLVTVITALLQAAAVALVLTLALSRGLGQPLQRLMGQLDRIDFSAGNLPRISGTGLEGAELVRLQRTLNDALERIDQDRLDLGAKNRELDELNKNLEKIVEERTAALTAANIQVNKELAVRKQVEKELIVAKQDAEAASEAKSLFINNMSHELRTPLSGIIVSAELALGQELPPKAEKNLQTIHRSGRSLLNTVTAILDFSKSESGKLELAAIPFRLDDVLQKLSGTFIQKGAEKQIEISFDIAADKVSNALIGDPDRLMEVFNHLLDNAAKFSTGAPKAVIGVKDVDTSAEKATLEFSVKDNGIGIASEDFAKIFDAFTQVDASSTRQYDGAGMGLAISKRLVAGMGGTIWVESELGKGSTFYFTASFDRQGQEHPFKVPAFIDREDITVKQVNSKISAEMGSPELLLELLLRIEPCIQQRKPKPCKEVMAEINGYSWPDEYVQDIAELDRLIGKYKFKDAQPVLEAMLEKIKSK